jgi:tRNA dimethylallyltransferase
MWRYLAGELNYASMSEQAIIATRQLAKRQLTWLRAETDSLWFDSQQTDLTQQVLNYLVRKLTVGQP